MRRGVRSVRENANILKDDDLSDRSMGDERGSDRDDTSELAATLALAGLTALAKGTQVDLSRAILLPDQALATIPSLAKMLATKAKPVLLVGTTVYGVLGIASWTMPSLAPRLSDASGDWDVGGLLRSHEDRKRARFVLNDSSVDPEGRMRFDLAAIAAFERDYYIIGSNMTIVESSTVGSDVIGVIEFSKSANIPPRPL